MTLVKRMYFENILSRRGGQPKAFGPFNLGEIVMHFIAADTPALTPNQVRRVNQLADIAYTQKELAIQEGNADLRQAWVNVGATLILITEDQ